jgi:hypothetical protein
MYSPSYSLNLLILQLAFPLPFGLGVKRINGPEVPPFLKPDFPGEARFLGAEAVYTIHLEDGADTGELSHK